MAEDEEEYYGNVSMSWTEQLESNSGQKYMLNVQYMQGDLQNRWHFITGSRYVSAIQWSNKVIVYSPVLLLLLNLLVLCYCTVIVQFGLNLSIF